MTTLVRRKWNPAIDFRRNFLAWICGFVLALASQTAEAVLFFATADTNFNTTPPTGELAGSGWEFQGIWGDSLGTPIAPQYFISARHIGGGIGNRFLFDGQEYRTTAFFDDPASDLRIWKVRGQFSKFATLYSSTNEPANASSCLGAALSVAPN